MMTQPAAAAAAKQEFAAAFDRETGGAFSRLVAHPDAADALRHYASLVAAWVKIEDSLYEAYSPQANTLPGWYADQLVAMGFSKVDASTSGAEALLERELESGDFDRVVHAFYVVSVSQLPLIDIGPDLQPRPTALWTEMIRVARADPENRYWIPLALAESRRLPPAEYEPLHTRMVSRTESVRERIGLGAAALGPRLPRVLGLHRHDPSVSNPHVDDAFDAAEERVREHELVGMGGPAAYRAVRQQLQAMEKGAFDSRRFLDLLRRDLPLLLQHFGLPEDPDALLDTVHVLCRGPGANRMRLWNAADDLEKRYEPLLAARRRPAPPPAPQDAAAILALGDGAEARLVQVLRKTTDAGAIRQLLAGDVIPAVVAARPAADPAALRRALRDAYAALGYPPALRQGYERAIDALGPEETPHDAASREKLAALEQRFAEVEDADAFDKTFDAYHRASADGLVPGRGISASFVSELARAAARVLEAEAIEASVLSTRVDGALRQREQASREIEAAEAAIADANAGIRSANAALTAAEAQEKTELAARNDAVQSLNAATEAVLAARSQGAVALEAARTEAARREAELNPTISRHELAYRKAAARAADAEQRAADLQSRARREQARARAAADREDAAGRSLRQVETDLDRIRARFREITARLVAGLGFAGIRGDPAALGDPGRPRDVRLAAVALLLASGAPPDDDVASALARERAAGDPAIVALADLVGRTPKDPTASTSASTR